MPKIIELEKDKDGVYRSSETISKNNESELKSTPKLDNMTQLIDGFEKGAKVINRIVRIIDENFKKD
mgnify:FL=1